ncbi:MAG: MFS transporter [Candidatus Bathyarchaeota archaeon]|nr:MFS transporter [Candidatus Bathyarchaeota archaeon]
MTRSLKSMVEEDRNYTHRNLRLLFVKSVLSSLGDGMVAPFISVYPILLGASPSDMGLIRSTTNFTQSILQTFWGRLSDNIGRRVPIIFFGGIIGALTWILIAYTDSVMVYLLLIVIQTLAVSAVTPVWTALIGDNTTSTDRARVVAYIRLWSLSGSIVAAAISGWISSIAGGSGREVYKVPLLIAGSIGIISSLIILYVREGERARVRAKKPLFSLYDLKSLKQDRVFYEFCRVNAIASFALSIAWPIFPITLQSILRLPPATLTILSISQGLASLSIQRYVDRVIGRYGCERVITIYRLTLIIVPTSYLLAEITGRLPILVANNIALGLISAMGETAYTAYLLGIVNELERGERIAVYNLSVGITTTVGSLVGGYIASVVEGCMGLIWATRIVYLISIAGRVATAIMVWKTIGRRV